jgi:hypothetical protein
MASFFAGERVSPQDGTPALWGVPMGRDRAGGASGQVDGRCCPSSVAPAPVDASPQVDAPNADRGCCRGRVFLTIGRYRPERVLCEVA